MILFDTTSIKWSSTYWLEPDWSVQRYTHFKAKHVGCGLCGIRNPESGIRNPAPGIQRTGIRWTGIRWTGIRPIHYGLESGIHYVWIPESRKPEARIRNPGPSWILLHGANLRSAKFYNAIVFGVLACLSCHVTSKSMEPRKSIYGKTVFSTHNGGF